MKSSCPKSSSNARNSNSNSNFIILFIVFSCKQVLAQSCTSITNNSTSLEKVLENGTLRGSCEVYFSKKDVSECAKLKCGKELFFYGDFKAKGLPAALYDFLEKNFSSLTGQGFSKFGMIPDPFSKEKFPIGVVPGAKLGIARTNVFTCASCHFGKTPNGIYSVGMANNSYDYGKQMLVLNVLPIVATKFGDKNPLKSVPPAAAKILKPYLDVLDQNPKLKIELVSKLIPLLFTGRKPPNISADMQLAYASWKTGTMDFLMQPLPFDDGVHSVSRITSIWDIPNDSQVEKFGMPHQLLGNTGATKSLDYFVEWFVRFMDGDLRYWNKERREPLAAYMAALTSPKLSGLNEDKVLRGAAVFQSQNCESCHNGVAYSGRQVFTVQELEVDSAIERWADPKLTGVPCCGLNFSGNDVATHGVKSPRLKGVWAQTNLLHNGSVESLEQLLCLSPDPQKSSTVVGVRDRGLSLPEPFSNKGHWYGCEELSNSQKSDLVEFLKSL
jgi:hypothetical protein